MRRPSERVRVHENGDVPPPAPTNWQEIIANLEARVQRVEEEARLARGQVPPPVPVAEVPPVQAPAVAPPRERCTGNHCMSASRSSILLLLMAV